MGEIAVSNRVVARNSIGRFLAECELAGEMMMRDMSEDGAALSRSLAPKGAKRDPRTPHLRDAITASSSATSAHWEADARHALAQEKGGAAHRQSGYARFFWEREGREWEPGSNQINHPGNPAHPYLRPAYEIIMGRWMEYARRYYPG